MIRLTRTGLLLLAAALLLYLASLTSQSSLLLLPIGLLLGSFLLNAFLAWQAIGRVEVVPPQKILAPEGLPLLEPWTLKNLGHRPVGMIVVSQGKVDLLRVKWLETQLSLIPTWSMPRRGVFPFQDLFLTSTYPFGLLRWRRGLKLAGELVVHPQLYPVPVPRAAGFDAMVGGKFRGRHGLSHGTEFDGVRPLQPGDPMRQVHWKSSLKGLGLMVKTFSEDLSGRVAILTDGGHTGAPEALDDCLRAGGSLMFAALDAGHHLEWVELGEGRVEVIPPFADGQALLEQLARVRLAPQCLTEVNLLSALGRVSSRSAVCLVLSTWTPAVGAVVGELRQQNRPVTVCLPEEVPAGPEGLECTVYNYNQTGFAAESRP